tara:strand:+ start:27093 stop:27953 length:861 start_codon:yes stop_codon:yes gene_type:complete
MPTHAIAILPYGQKLGRRHAGRPLDDLHWPLGRPARLRNGTLADLSPDDHLIVYPKTGLHFQPDWGVKAKVSVMVVEPAMIHARHLKLLRWTYRRFFRVLTHNDNLLSAIPNGIKHPFGTTWIPDHSELDVTKSRHMSLIASTKRDLEGHLLRHDMVSFVQSRDLDVDVLGRGFAPFEDKADGLAPYRFSVVIENIQEPNYFTEKIVDAVLCEAVPIYWGCPNIGDFFDTEGMVICNSAEELKAAISAASQNQFDRLIPALRADKSRAAHWGDLEGRAAQSVLDSL